MGVVPTSLADDARLPADARQHQHDERRRRAQRRAGSGRLSETQAMPGTISASATVSQPFSSAMVSASASAATAPVAKMRARRRQCRARRAPDQRFGRERKQRGEQQRRAGEGDRPLEVLRCGNRARSGWRSARTPPMRSTASARPRLLRASLREETGAAEQRRKTRSRARDAIHSRPVAAPAPHPPSGPTARRDGEIEFERPAARSRARRARGGRHRGGGGFRAPGDRDASRRASAAKAVSATGSCRLASTRHARREKSARARRGDADRCGRARRIGSKQEAGDDERRGQHKADQRHGRHAAPAPSTRTSSMPGNVHSTPKRDRSDREPAPQPQRAPARMPQR